VASALVLAPLAVGAAYLGGWYFLLFWWLAAAGVLWEWTGLAAAERLWPITATGAIAFAVAAASLLLGHARIALPAIALGVGVAAMLAVPGRRAWAGLGVLYAAAVLLPVVLLREEAAHGLAAVVLLFAVVWATDVAAYFGGRLIGGPKLWARVSPKKTWSGALVGTAAAIAGGLLVAHLAGIAVGAPLALVCLLLSAVSQAGDLFESAVKRRFDVKDSSHIIPGHGGLMDRLDGFVTAAAAAIVIGLCHGGPTVPASGLLIW
jgi:phosphatidate cytidylyltransferase